MTFPGARPVAILAVLLIALLDVSAEGQTRKQKPAPKRKPAATRRAKPKPKPVALSVPVGATFEERLASLVNGTVARSSDASIQIVELESGRPVAERNPHLALSPASNMKLFTHRRGH